MEGSSISPTWGVAKKMEIVAIELGGGGLSQVTFSRRPQKIDVVRTEELVSEGLERLDRLATSKAPSVDGMF